MEIRKKSSNKLSEENEPVSPKLMRLLTKHKFTLKGPYPSVEKVSRAIRKKCHNICARLKGLAMVYMYVNKGDKVKG